MRDTAPTTADPAIEADICVLLNPGSGDSGDPRPELEMLFAHHPGRFALRRVEPGEGIVEAAHAAIDAGFETIVAAGGDGTISGVAPLVAGVGRRFGVLPLGTFNYFARALELPEDMEGAVDVLVNGAERDVPIGEVNGEGFLNNASIGAYAAILQARERVYRNWGRSRAAAYWSVLVTLARFRSPLTARVTVDGTLRRVRTPLVFVAANAYQLEVFGLPGADCVRDGQFAVFIAPDCKRLELLRFAIRLALRSMEQGRDFELICGRDILVEPRQKRRLVARDGERARMTAPFRFRMRPKPLRMLVPAASEAPERE